MKTINLKKPARINLRKRPRPRINLVKPQPTTFVWPIDWSRES